MDRNQKICFGFIIIYIGISLFFMISVFLLINGLPIDDFILFFNKINENLDIESINNIILRINDNFDFIYFTAKKISNVTNNIDNFKDTAETINTQLTNYNETIYYLTDNIDNFKDYSNKLNNTMFEIISTIRYFQSTAENINNQMVYFDNLNVTLKYFSDNMNNVNSTILRINNRLTNIEDNIELILYNTNQENMVSSPSGEINFIN